jgi:hypothetical protein
MLILENQEKDKKTLKNIEFTNTEQNEKIKQ